MVVKHSQETCARNLHTFLAQVSCIKFTCKSMHVLVQETMSDGQVSCTSRLVQVSCTSFLTVCHHRNVAYSTTSCSRLRLYCYTIFHTWRPGFSHCVCWVLGAYENASTEKSSTFCAKAENASTNDAGKVKHNNPPSKLQEAINLRFSVLAFSSNFSVSLFWNFLRRHDCDTLFFFS